MTVDLVIVVITRFDKAKGDHFQAKAEKLDDAQRRKLAMDKDVTYSVDGSLFLGEGLTQRQITKAAERALADAADGLQSPLSR